MIHELYHFNWNITDKRIHQHQKFNSEELERMWWRDTDEIFSTWSNLATAIVSTHQLLMAIVFGELLLGFRQLVRIASKLLLARIAPEFANQLSTWGEEDREPWSFALFHEEMIG